MTHSVSCKLTYDTHKPQVDQDVIRRLEKLETLCASLESRILKLEKSSLEKKTSRTPPSAFKEPTSSTITSCECNDTLEIKSPVSPVTSGAYKDTFQMKPSSGTITSCAFEETFGVKPPSTTITSNAFKTPVVVQSPSSTVTSGSFKDTFRAKHPSSTTTSGVFKDKFGLNPPSSSLTSGSYKDRVKVKSPSSTITSGEHQDAIVVTPVLKPTSTSGSHTPVASQRPVPGNPFLCPSYTDTFGNMYETDSYSETSDIIAKAIKTVFDSPERKEENDYSDEPFFSPSPEDVNPLSPAIKVPPTPIEAGLAVDISSLELPLNAQEELTPRKLRRIQEKVFTRQNFAWRLTQKVFSLDELLGHNCNGINKPALNEEKLDFVRNKTFLLWPTSKLSEEINAWKLCICAIDKGIRSLAKKLKDQNNKVC